MSLNNSSLLLYTISSYAIPSHSSMHTLPHTYLTLPPHTLSLTLSPSQSPLTLFHSHFSHSPFILLSCTLSPHTLSLTLSPSHSPPSHSFTHTSHTRPSYSSHAHSPLTLSPSYSFPSHSPRHTLPLSCTLLPVISSFFSVVRRMSGLDRAFASRVKSSSTDATILSLSLEVMEGRVTRRLGAGGVATLLA